MKRPLYLNLIAMVLLSGLIMGAMSGCRKSSNGIFSKKEEDPVASLISKMAGTKEFHGTAEP